ncbi:hypothetical protein Tco_0410474 [Tanacetum coccineum]
MSDAGINGHSIGIGGRYDDAIHVIRTDISSDRQMGSGTYEANNQPYMYPHDLHTVSPMSTTDPVLDGIIPDETLLLLAEERMKNTARGSRPRYNHCSREGRVALRTYQIYPKYIKMLLEDRHFLENIRAYNQMFSMTSLGAHIKELINNGRGPYVFKIFGQLYHWIGSLCSTVTLFKMTREKFEDKHILNFKVRLYNVVGAREYELPTGDMLGAIVYEMGPEANMDYDIVLEERSGQPQRINKLHPC